VPKQYCTLASPKQNFMLQRIQYILLLICAFPAFAQAFQSVESETVLEGEMSVRAILFDNNKIWYAEKGRYGYVDFSDNTKFEKRIIFDSIKPDFRSIAKTSQSVFILNAGSPALLYKISMDGSKPKLVYHEPNKKAFYDSMKFWNDTEGIAIGDPIDGCLSLIVTRDGGNSWRKIPCSKLPPAVDGEGAFAASNTNIVIKGDDTWIVTGGKRSRVFFSSDKGNTWTTYNTPIIEGSEMTGIFTADFADRNNGFIAGGNYEMPQVNSGNKAITEDGGKTWALVSENAGFGYASCVQFVPESDGKGLVCVGTSGLYYSDDNGQTWKKLSDDAGLYTIRFIDDHTAFAAGKNKIVKLIFKK
jgi:photosystem II stability/assembly factor-like uncharacterized protein